MGCSGDREKGPPEYTAKWDFITLSDFKSTSSWTSVAYIWLWLMALVSVAVYAVDTFTAINLLVFDRWSSRIQPALAIKYSRWIFAACIILSWTLCLYEWMRAIRVIRRGGVAESYMDPLAVSLQSMRGRGWRRFLVFTALTKSRKGADYVAFFVYFAFNGAIRVILAEGPRQVVNGMTLYAVMKADLLGKPSAGNSSIAQFFINIGTLANGNRDEAIILFSMLFTLVIWVFSALSLILACIMYLLFLWHYIPQRDGRLSIYCRRKVDRRLEKIVEHKIKAAIEDDENQKQKAEKRAELKRQKTGELLPPQAPKLLRQPTLPQLGESTSWKEDERQSDMQLARHDTTATVSTLPRYTSGSSPTEGVERQPTLPDSALDRPGMLNRTGTQASAWTTSSYESDAPLLANAGYAGEGGRGTPGPSLPAPTYGRQGSNASWNRPAPGRTMTQSSQATQRPFSPMSSAGPLNARRPPGPMGPPSRSNTGFSFDTNPQSAISPTSPQDAYGRPMGPPSRQNTYDSFRTTPGGYGSQNPSFDPSTPAISRMPSSGPGRRQPSFSRPMPTPRRPSQTSFNRPFTPAAAAADGPPPPRQPDSYEMTEQPRASSTAPEPPRSAAGAGYLPFRPPTAAAAAAAATRTPSILQPGAPPAPRHITVAGQPGAAGNYFGHVRDAAAAGPAPAPRASTPQDSMGYADILDDYGAA